MNRRLHPHDLGGHSGSVSHAPTAAGVARARLVGALRRGWNESDAHLRDRMLCRALAEYCADTPVPPALLQGMGSDYRRIELERDHLQGWRLMAMVWAPGQQSSLHTHGGRPAHEAIWRGELSVEHFESTPLADGRVLLCLLARETLSTPDTQVSPRFHEDIHRCSNFGEVPCVSLHLLPLQTPPQRDYVLCSDGAFEIVDAAPETFETLRL